MVPGHAYCKSVTHGYVTQAYDISKLQFEITETYVQAIQVRFSTMFQTYRKPCKTLVTVHATAAAYVCMAGMGIPSLQWLLSSHT